MLRRRLLVGGLLATGVAGCAGSPPRPKSGKPLALGARLVMRTTAGTERAIVPEQPVFSGDAVALYLSPSESLMLYVVEQQPGGSLRLLQPAGRTMAANTETRLPADAGKWFQITTAPGKTLVGVIASREPRSGRSELFRLVTDAAMTTGSDEAIVAIDPTYPPGARPSEPATLGLPRRTFKLRCERLTREGADVHVSSRGSPLVLVLAVDTRGAS